MCCSRGCSLDVATSSSFSRAMDAQTWAKALYYLYYNRLLRRAKEDRRCNAQHDLEQEVCMLRAHVTEANDMILGLQYQLQLITSELST